MVVELLPLLSQRHLHAPIVVSAKRNHTQADFITDVQRLAEELSSGRYILNFCHNRYHFMVTLGASLLTQKISLLPSTRTAAVLRQIKDNYPQVFCMRDRTSEEAVSEANIPQITFPVDKLSHLGDSNKLVMPMISAEQVVALVFTSGSTGMPQAHQKTWGSLVRSAHAERSALGMDEAHWGLVGTIPSQHMYGLESVIMLTMQGGAQLWAGHPFYPADIAAALSVMPRPRMLVTTPVHLRALLNSQVELPDVDKILSATAPLPIEMATQAEVNFSAPVEEIYGCTETGQLASRRSTMAQEWRLLSNVRLTERNGVYWAAGGHIATPTPLADQLIIKDAEHFLLQGRNSDLINISGKRGSLNALNQALLELPGVRDAHLFVPDIVASDAIASVDVVRLCALVVAPEHNATQIVQALRQHIDAAFIPRPIIFLPQLPRNETGKISHEVAQNFYADYLSKRQQHVPSSYGDSMDETT